MYICASVIQTSHSDSAILIFMLEYSKGTQSKFNIVIAFNYHTLTHFIYFYTSF